MPRLPGVRDVTGLLHVQAEALAQLPMTLVAINRSLRSLNRTLMSLERTAARLDALAADIEEPVRSLAPGLRRLAVVLDDPVVDTIPETVREIRDNVVPVVRNLNETQERIIAAADRIGNFPGAALFRRQSRQVDSRQVEPPPDDPPE